MFETVLEWSLVKSSTGNIKLGWKCLTVTNTLAFYGAVKSFRRPAQDDKQKTRFFSRIFFKVEIKIWSGTNFFSFEAKKINKNRDCPIRQEATYQRSCRQGGPIGKLLIDAGLKRSGIESTFGKFEEKAENDWKIKNVLSNIFIFKTNCCFFQNKNWLLHFIAFNPFTQRNERGD